MSKTIFVNLPVTDLSASTRFYKTIGCELNEQFSNETASSLIWSDTITFMLLTHEFFSTFTSKNIIDAHKHCEVLIALSLGSREDVDSITHAAAEAGGKIDIREPQDMDFMYGRTFEDLDGHVFEPMWMNLDAMPEN